MPRIPTTSLHRLASQPQKWAYPAHFIAGRRLGGYKHISIQSTPSTDSAQIEVVSKSTAVSSPDATFEILGQPYSVLSIRLSPSQPLHTRRGTLLGLSGDPSTVTSQLRLLSPVLRLPLFIPFLYQRITSTTPITLLIATPSTHTSLCILHLNGTTDWTLPTRSSLLAYTGSTLTITPHLTPSLSLSHWGTTTLTGRGLISLSGLGQLSTITLLATETIVLHPTHILAYTSSNTPTPQPYRFKSRNLNLSIPLQLGQWFSTPRFFRALQDSAIYKTSHNILMRVRTWSRRTIWGDRLFLRFEGPATIVVQSRAGRVRDVLTKAEVNEIADAPAGIVGETVRGLSGGGGVGVKKRDEERMGVQGATGSASPEEVGVQQLQPQQQPKLSVASVSKDGKVSFEATKEGKGA